MVCSVAVGLGLVATQDHALTRLRGEREDSLSKARSVQRWRKSCSWTVAMDQQTALTNWDHAFAWKITWTEWWKSEPAKVKFLTWVVYNVLPSPSNLHSWSLAETSASPLCLTRGSLGHILNCCPKALEKGRYTWLHSQVQGDS